LKTGEKVEDKAVTAHIDEVLKDYLAWCKWKKVRRLEAMGIGRAMLSVFPNCESFQATDPETKMRKRMYMNLDMKPFVEPDEDEDLL